MSVLKLTVCKNDIKDSFMRFAGRSDIADEVVICLKRPKGYKCFPENLIKEYFKDSQNKTNGKIRRIEIKGTNDAGSFEVDANIKSLKEEMADSTQYKPVGGKQLSLFQILLSNIAYNVIVEIIYLVILIGIALIRPIIPLQALKYVAAVCIFAIMHILGVLLESVAQMYLTFWRNR